MTSFLFVIYNSVMEIIIKVKEIAGKDKLSKTSNGTNIFNKMYSEFKKNNEIKKFILDVAGMKQISVFVFVTIVRQMQSRLNGNYGLELVNAVPIVAQQFKLALR